MKILGINDGHNAAACLYANGRIAAAIQEERLRRVKNWAGFPIQAVRAVLEMTRTAPGEIDAVAMNGHYAAYPMSREQLMEEYRTINDWNVVTRRAVRRAVKRAAQPTGLYAAYRQHRQRERAAPLVQLGIPWEKVTFVEHHTAHAATAYYGWGHFSDPVLVLTCDGAGDGLCATVNIGRAGRLERLHSVPQADSIGNMYAMATFLLGMVPLEHEYKLMGLAPYADPKGTERVYQLLAPLLRFPARAPLGWERADGCPDTYCSYRFFRKLFERQRFDWIAGGLQKFTESMLTEWVRRCVRITGIGRVALSGGVFMNVKANKAIMELPEVEELFVYPSCGDETNAMGAAYWVYAQGAGTATMAPLQDLYWGPQYCDEDIGRAIEGFAFSAPVRWTFHDPIEPRVAGLLAEGKVVARFAGREEFGARALGNRSILANPSDPAVVREINEAIKARDFWMPFAPSMLAARNGQYVVNPKHVASPYMILSFDTTDRRRDIRAAIHPFDFTARPQEVSAAWNPSYHALLTEFERLTGIGGVLNTSFNLHGFPIVSSPQDALDVFDRSGLRYLAIGNWLVEKC